MRSRPIVLTALLFASPAGAATLLVGPGQTYTKPCQAIAAASAGDTIQVDAAGNGTYDGDSCSWSTDNLTVQGINGRASINAGGDPTSGVESNISGDKGIFVIAANNATIQNFELSGAVANPGSNNGAGIRHQGLNLTVQGCYFHDNQDGILGAPATAGTGTVLIENSEFAHNGAGDGFSHNMYIGDYALFTLRYSYSHESDIGHLVKSRAYETHIEYNLLADLADGTGSYEVDVPQGGLTYIIGNAIEQSQSGASNGNPAIISFHEESEVNPIQQLYLVNNTIVNDATSGTFVVVDQSPGVVAFNNIFRGPGTIWGGNPAPTPTETDDWTDTQGDPMLVDQATYNYQLQAGSPCIDAGVDPGSGNSEPLEPTDEYVVTCSGETRDNSHWDLGAFEFQDQGTPVGTTGGFGGTTGTAPGTTTGTASTGATGTAGASSAGATSTGAHTSTSAGATSAAATSGGTTAAHGTTSAGAGSTGAKGTSSTSGGHSGTTGASTGKATTTSAASSGGSSGEAPDAGTPPSINGSGCGCSSGSAGESVLGLLGCLLLLRRRRR